MSNKRVSVHFGQWIAARQSKPAAQNRLKRVSTGWEGNASSSWKHAKKHAYIRNLKKSETVQGEKDKEPVGESNPTQKVLQKLLNQSGSCEVDTGACCSLQLPDEYGTLVRACLFEKVHVNILENKLDCLKILKYAWYAISCPVSVWIFDRNGLFGYPFLFYRAVELAYTGENAVMMTYLDDDGATIRFQIFMCNTSKLPKDKLMNESTSYDSQRYPFFSPSRSHTSRQLRFVFHN